MERGHSGWTWGCRGLRASVPSEVETEAPKEGAPAFMEHLLHAQAKVELYLYFIGGKLRIKENTCYLPITHPK